jgi:hypothetical protein
MFGSTSSMIADELSLYPTPPSHLSVTLTHSFFLMPDAYTSGAEQRPTTHDLGRASKCRGGRPPARRLAAGNWSHNHSPRAQKITVCGQSSRAPDTTDHDGWAKQQGLDVADRGGWVEQ